MVQQQAENSRKRILFGVNNLGQRRVAYWSIDTPIDAYALPDALALSVDCAARAATMRTRLNPFTADEIKLLLRSGYAGADASLRARGLATNSPPANLDALPKPQR